MSWFKDMRKAFGFKTKDKRIKEHLEFIKSRTKFAGDKNEHWEDVEDKLETKEKNNDRS